MDVNFKQFFLYESPDGIYVDDRHIGWGLSSYCGGIFEDTLFYAKSIDNLKYPLTHGRLTDVMRVHYFGDNARIRYVSDIEEIQNYGKLQAIPKLPIDELTINKIKKSLKEAMVGRRSFTIAFRFWDANLNDLAASIISFWQKKTEVLPYLDRIILFLKTIDSNPHTTKFEFIDNPSLFYTLDDLKGPDAAKAKPTSSEKEQAAAQAQQHIISPMLKKDRSGGGKIMRSRGKGLMPGQKWWAMNSESTDITKRSKVKNNDTRMLIEAYDELRGATRSNSAAGLRDYDGESDPLGNMPAVHTIEELKSIADKFGNRALMMYPAHAMDMGGMLPATTIMNMYARSGGKRFLDIRSDSPELSDMKEFAAKSGGSIQPPDEGYFLPVVDFPQFVDSEGSGKNDKKGLVRHLENMGYKIFDVPYGSPLHKHWSFD